MSIYATLIYPGEVVGPFLIYQTADPNIKIVILESTIALSDTKYAFILGISRFSDKKQKVYWIKISFLSTG
jgi:hypothetical protein